MSLRINLSKLNVCLALSVLDPAIEEKRIVIIPMPTSVPRTILVNEGGFVLLEDLVARFCSSLFPGEEITAHTTFRLTRNTDIPANEDEAHDFAEEINDVITYSVQGWSAEYYADLLIRHFDQLLEEGQKSGTVMCIPLTSMCIPVRKAVD